MIKKGDLIRFKRSGRIATALKDEYSARFMEAEDYEMMDHGMGHLAGIYGTAVDVCFADTQQIRRRIKVSYSSLEVISESR